MGRCDPPTVRLRAIILDGNFDQNPMWAIPGATASAKTAKHLLALGMTLSGEGKTAVRPGVGLLGLSDLVRISYRRLDWVPVPLARLAVADRRV
ncbi:hypothetical protein ASD99_24595 [Mesorhizobium sp. Root695]|nr:hypothetical protein ASD99_24595 [Mesorhizobium sp. Root695]